LDADKIMAPKKKIAAKRPGRNKGLQVRKRDGITPAQVKRIREILRDRGVVGVRDLALFSTAIDTMLLAAAGVLGMSENLYRTGRRRFHFNRIFN
jgi:hypothetical protein